MSTLSILLPLGRNVSVYILIYIPKVCSKLHIRLVERVFLLFFTNQLSLYMCVGACSCKKKYNNFMYDTFQIYICLYRSNIFSGHNFYAEPRLADIRNSPLNIQLHPNFSFYKLLCFQTFSLAFQTAAFWSIYEIHIKTFTVPKYMK